MAYVLESKRPTEVRYHRHDWSAFLDGDTIATSSWAVADTAVVIDDDTNDDTTATVWVSGGTAGTIATLTNTITTADGLTEIETFLLQIVAADEPVNLIEAKAQCRMSDDNSEDTFIASLIAPARAYVERVSRCLFVEGTRVETFRRWGDYLEIWRRPITSITSVTYSTSDDPVDDVEYEGFAADFNSFPLRIYPAFGGNGFPTLVEGQTITVTYVAGALAATDEEYLIGKRAILLLIGHWFEFREAALIGQVTDEIAYAVSSLLDEIRPVSAY
jgi:uncharacterized phiE125 gp8 family phage protein